MAHAPVIEGTLKTTIHAIAFGLISTVLAITFGKLLVPNFFFWTVAFVVFLEFVLLSIPRKKEENELYQAPGRKGVHTVESAGGLEIKVHAPEDDACNTPKKKAGIRERFHRKDKTAKKDLLKTDADYADSYEQSGRPVSPKRSPKLDRKINDEAHKTEKSAATEKSCEEVKDKVKGKVEGADVKAEEKDEDKAKGKAKSGGWKKRLPQRKSQSEDA